MPVVELEINSSGAVQGLRQFDVAADRSAATLGTLREGLNSLGQKLFDVSKIVGVAAVGFGAFAIKSASDLQETQGKFDVVFGKFDAGFKGLIQQSESWAENLNKNYGLSENSAKKYLSSIQDLIVPTGLARDVSADLSNKFVKLAVDIASFNNKANADVIADFQSALAGSAETMVKYGIDVRKTALEQEALRLGLVKAGQELTRQASVQAMYSIAMRESADAVGDFERTSASFANQSKVLQKNMQDFAATVGNELLPYATQAITALNEWAAVEGNLNSVIVGGVETIRFLTNGVMGTILAFQGLAFGALRLAKGLTYLMTPLEVIIDGLRGLGVIDIDFNPITKLKGEIDGLKKTVAGAMEDQWKRIEKTNSFFDEMSGKYKQVATDGDKSSKSQVDSQKKIQESVSKTSKMLAQPGAKIGEVSPKAFTDLATLEKQLGVNIDKSGTLAHTWKLVGGVWVEALKDGRQITDGMVVKIDELTNAAAANRIEVEKIGGVWVQTGDSLRGATSTAKSDLDLLKESIRGAGAQAEEFNTQLAKLSGLDKSATSLKQEIKGIQAEFKAGLVSQEEYIDKFNQLTVAELALGRVKGQMSDLKEEINRGTEEAKKFANVQKELSTLDSGVRKLGDSYSQLKDDVTGSVGSLESFNKNMGELGTLDAQARALGKEISTLESAIDSGALSATELKKRFFELTVAKEALKNVQGSMERLTEEIGKGAEETRKFVEIQDKLAKLDGVIDGFGDEYDDFKKVILSSSSAVASLRANFEKLGGLDVKARSLSKEVSILREALDSGRLSTEEFAKRFEQLQIAEIALKGVKRQMSELTEEISKGNDEAQKFIDTQKELSKLDKTVSALGSEYQELKDNVSESADSLGRFGDQLEKLGKLDKQARSLKDEVSSLRSAIDSGTLSAEQFQQRFRELTVAEIALEGVEKKMSSLTDQIKAGTEATKEFNSAQSSAAGVGPRGGEKRSYQFSVDTSDEGIERRLKGLRDSIRGLKSIKSYKAGTFMLEDEVKRLEVQQIQRSMQREAEKFFSTKERLARQRTPYATDQGQAREGKATPSEKGVPDRNIVINNRFEQSFSPENIASISIAQARQARWQ